MLESDETPSPADAHEHSVRLQVLLARYGVASRRHAADAIREGRVVVDGQVVREPGLRVDPDRVHIRVDGLPLRTAKPPRHRTILLNKPRGLICSADEEQGPTVFDCLQTIRERLVPVGRLDKDSEGLLLLSNDGPLVNALTHPRFGHRKEYLVTVRGEISGTALATLRSAMTLDDGTVLRPVEVQLVDSEPGRDPPRHRLLMTLGEGRNRQVRRMCETVGLYVERLIRLAIGGLRLPRALRPGEWRDVTPDELRALSRDSRSDESDDDSTTDSGTAENQHETVDGPWTDHV
jgi:23S rRNA pseudouridine2605 synthase